MSNTKPAIIKWRGHPTERQCEGKAPGLTYPVSVCHLVHCGGYGEFGIYYGGSLIEKVMSPWETDEQGNDRTFVRNGKTKKIRDTEAGYKAAKARAQELVPTFMAQDAAAHKALVDRQNAEIAAREAREQAAAEAAALRAEALALAGEISEEQVVLCNSDGEAVGEPRFVESERARRLAEIVAKLLGGN